MLFPKKGHPRLPGGNGSDRAESGEDPGHKMRLYCLERKIMTAAPSTSSILLARGVVRGMVADFTKLRTGVMLRAEEEGALFVLLSSAGGTLIWREVRVGPIDGARPSRFP
jgi:hypothetical protein